MSKAESVDAVREAREARALSQEAFARLLGVSVRTVARWESGTSRPSSLALQKLQDVAVREPRSTRDGIA
jgi:putative transcriptional regulator